MSRALKSTVAALAFAGVMGMPLAALAQTAEAPAETAPATQPTEASEALPPLLQQLNLSDVKIKEDRRGKKVRGQTADGAEIRAFVDDQGNVRGVMADDKVALPDAVVQQMLPEAVRNQGTLSQFATISAVFSAERGVMVGGVDANGQQLRAGFSQDGTLMRFGRGEEAGRGEGKHGHWGKERHGWGHKHKEGWGHKGGDDRRGDAPAPLSDEAVLKAVQDAGYTEAGQITREGPSSFVSAKNPEGESVRVEVTPKGDVVRETAE